MMTRPVRDRILKDANGDISDHLRNHIHLTNCIHLKNHMHKHSPILGDRSLMRDLIVLQRSRSLRDPSASPPWHSPSVVDVDAKAMSREGRRSVGIERRRDSRRLSGSSVHLACGAAPKVSPRDHDEVGALSERSRRIGIETPQGKDHNGSESVDRKSSSRQKGKKHIHDAQVRTLSDRLKDIPGDSDGGRVKRRRYRGGARKARGVEMSATSNSFAQAQLQRKHEEEEEEYAEQDLTRGAPRNGCGIPWNWSRIHHRGKTFLDIAGRSLSCGLSESRLRKGGPDMPVASDGNSSSGSQAMPLLVEGLGSQASSENRGWVHDYSGELGIYADHLLKHDHDMDSDLASEARSGSQHRIRRPRQRQHQSLTQRYTPRTFRDLVGQNLVAQGLSNAVTKRKVGLLYVFHGPHGTGKTSCARIFARALNCQSSDHPKPCGFCNSCIAHDMGKSKNIKEVGPMSDLDFESMLDLLDNISLSPATSQYRVFIFDDCDTLPSDCWSAITKVVNQAPRRVVFVLVSSGLDVLPHIIMSRCQKFFFPKLKDADIIYTLQWIATREDLEIDKDALKLIASRSDGSLRDAEMTLEQLSLLGQRISVPLVQELVGLISDEKLVDLLDLALSADTVNTVKSLRVIMETSVEPLALMSQLATVITDILAGSYDFTRERHRRKFFRRQPLSKEDMEKLRQALKTLSEAEKQLRVSNDKLTWLTAALLQLAPDQQYMMPTSADTSFHQSPLALDRGHSEMACNGNGVARRSSVDRQRQAGSGMALQKRLIPGKSQMEIEDVWLEVLGRIQITSVKHFLYHEGKLVSVSFGAAPTVNLMFSSHQAKSKAEKFKEHILQAFEYVLSSPVTIEIRCIEGPGSKAGSPQVNNEIVEVEASPRDERRKHEHVDNGSGSDGRSLGTAWVRQVQGSQKNESLSIVRSKVSLAHVIQQGEGCSQGSGWSKRKAVSIAEKLEEENMRMEPRSRSLLCWKTSRVTRRKLSRLKIRTRRPHSLLKLVSCGKCLSSKSPRK